MIVCPSCGKTNGDGRRHCNWCGCYLPPLLREEDRAVPWTPNTWSGTAMLRTEAELMKKGLISMYDGEYIGELKSMMKHPLVSVLYEDDHEQILVEGNGNIVRVLR